MVGRLLLAVWRTNRLLPLSVLALLAVNGALFFWIDLSLSPRVNELERHFLKTRELAQRSAEQFEQARSPQVRFEKTEADLRSFAQLIPQQSEFTGLLKELFSVAETAGLSIEQITYQPKQLEDRNLLQYGLVFSVMGDYGQIKRFVHALEQSPRIIAIDGIALSGDSSEDGRGVKLNIRLTTFFSLERPS